MIVAVNFLTLCLEHYILTELDGIGFELVGTLVPFEHILRKELEHDDDGEDAICVVVPIVKLALS